MTAAAAAATEHDNERIAPQFFLYYYFIRFVPIHALAPLARFAFVSALAPRDCCKLVSLHLVCGEASVPQLKR